MDQKVLWVTSRIFQAFSKGIKDIMVNAKKNDIRGKKNIILCRIFQRAAILVLLHSFLLHNDYCGNL